MPQIFRPKIFPTVSFRTTIQVTKPNDEAGALGGTDLTDDGEIPDGMCNLVSAFTRGSGSGSVESRYIPCGFACLKCVLCYSASGLRLGSQGEKMDEKMWPRGQINEF